MSRIFDVQTAIRVLDVTRRIEAMPFDEVGHRANRSRPGGLVEFDARITAYDDAGRTRFKGRRVDVEGDDIDEEDIVIYVRTYPDKGADLKWHTPQPIGGSNNVIPIRRKRIKIGTNLESVWMAVWDFNGTCAAEAVRERGPTIPPPTIGGEPGGGEPPGGGIDPIGEGGEPLTDGDRIVDPNQTINELSQANTGGRPCCG